MNFVSYYYEGALNSGDDTKLPGVTNMPEVHGAIQKDLQQAGEMTCQEFYEVQQSPAPGTEQPQAPAHAKDQAAGK